MIAALLALAIRLALTPIVHMGFPFITFFPAVVAIAFILGRGPGLFATALTGATAAHFFLPPIYTNDFWPAPAVGLLFYALVCVMIIGFVDIAHRSSAAAVRERGISSQLSQTRELLFRELQHRVSNNLQVIGALLAAQRRRIDDPAARAALEEAGNRLTIIGRISRELYRPDGARSDLHGFLQRLAEAVLDTYARPDVTCRFAVADDVLLDSDHAVPLALVFTETLANALEHGLPDCAGQVVVTLARMPHGGVELIVADDGCGLPAGFDAATSDSLGLRIARQLAQQLGGSFTIGPRDGMAGTEARLQIAA